MYLCQRFKCKLAQKQKICWYIHNIQRCKVCIIFKNTVALLILILSLIELWGYRVQVIAGADYSS